MRFNLFTLMLLFVVSKGHSQSEETKYPETVLIKLIETTYTGVSVQAESKIITVNPDNTVETKLLERASMLKDAGEALENNMTRIRTELQKWQNNGFHIQAISSASPMNYLIITTVILVNN